jgi:hypothetical protein
MADITITDLDADSSVAESDLFLKRTSNGADYKTTAGKIKEYVKSALINEGTGSSSFATVAQIAKASGVSLTTGTSSVLGSTTVEVFDAIKTYGKNTKSNVTAILSGLEIGDLDYTKYTNSSGAYESQLSVEIGYTYANGRGYAHIIPKLKNQQSYTMYMLSSNTSLDGVWQKDTDKVLSETHSATLNFTNSIPFTVGKDTDTTGEQTIRTKFGSTENNLINIYRPAVHTSTENNSENNVYFGNKRNTVIGSGALGESAWSTNKTNKTNAKLYLTGQDGIELSTGNSDYSKATKSTLDKSGNLTIANNITANGKMYANTKEVPTFNFSKIHISTQNKDSSSAQLYPYMLLASRTVDIKGQNCYEEFYFDVYLQQFASTQRAQCKLSWNTVYTASTTSTAVTTTPALVILKAEEGSNKKFFNLLKLRYTHVSNDTMKIWIYADFTNLATSYFAVSLLGGMDTIMPYTNTPNGADWTYYIKSSNTSAINCSATMEGENDGATNTYAVTSMGSLVVNNKFTAVNGNFETLDTSGTVQMNGTTNIINNPTLKWTVGDESSTSGTTYNVVMRKSGNSSSYALSLVVTKSGETTSTFYPVIDSSGELAINRARVSTTEPTSPVDGDMWFV